MVESVIIEYGDGLEVLAPDLDSVAIETQRHYEDFSKYGWVFEGLIPIDRERFVRNSLNGIGKKKGIEFYIGFAYYCRSQVRNFRALLYRVGEK